MSHMIDIAVIGGGAAGFFAAVHAADGKNKVVILEKTHKLLSKVKVSGGGRCNVTNSCSTPNRLLEFYPRGGKTLKKAFEKFGPIDTVNWFESRGVKLKTEEDGRIFPISDDSQTIIDCLRQEAEKKKVEIRLKVEVLSLEKVDEIFYISIKGGETLQARKVIISCGGNSKADAYNWLQNLGLKIEKPIPSLFTFNVPDSDLKDLQGLSVKNGSVQIPGTKWKDNGPLLITHWGFSAPAVIKLSSRAAIDLYDRNYHFPILLNWCGMDENTAREQISTYKNDHPKKLVRNNQLLDIPLRLWQQLCKKAEISADKRYLDLSKKQLNKLVELLVRSDYTVRGKTTFKEEFVTCGGVNLQNINIKTFEAKNIKGLYLAGEVLNVDGLTGGFNFQHAWTSGYIAGVHSRA